MADGVTTIQISPTVRDELRKEKASASALSGRSVDHDALLLALLRFWRAGTVEDTVTTLQAVAGRVN